MKREDLDGIEFDWFAIDKDNHIAHFSTAGYGAVPLQVIENIDEQDKLLDYFKDRPGTLSARLLIRKQKTKQGRSEAFLDVEREPHLKMLTHQ